MTELSIEKIATYWINRYKRSNLKSETQWAYNALDELIATDPKIAFEVIVAIFNKTENEFVLENLAAGPMEDLLVRHGNEIICDVEKFTVTEPKFSHLLAGIWENNIHQNVLAKINVLLDKYLIEDD